MKTTAIVLVAGSSTRFNSSTPKQMAMLGDKPVFMHSVDAFASSKDIDEIIVVTNSNLFNEIKEKTTNLNNLTVILGGNTRQESVKHGLDMIKNFSTDDIAIIHDGARPLLDQETIHNVIKVAKEFDAATTYINQSDTTAHKSNNGMIENFVDRSSLVSIQTPQAFKVGLIKKAHENASDSNATDDCTLVMNMKINVKLVEGNKKLTKITTAEDFKYLESLLK